MDNEEYKISKGATSIKIGEEEVEAAGRNIYKSRDHFIINTSDLTYLTISNDLKESKLKIENLMKSLFRNNGSIYY